MFSSAGQREPDAAGRCRGAGKTRNGTSCTVTERTAEAQSQCDAGGMQDREITSFDGRTMTVRFLDPEVSGRYGTQVYVRCAPRA